MLKQYVMFVIIPTVFSLSGCNSEDYPLSTIQQKLNYVFLSTEINGDKKKEFFPGEAIGIYPVAYLEEGPGTLGNLSNRINIPFVYDGTRWCTTPGQELFLEEKPIDIYGYYPYDGDIGWTSGKTDPTTYPFSVEGDQALFNPDFMWAKQENVYKNNNNVSLMFNHLMTRVRINLSFETPLDNPRLTIHNSKVACSINLSNGSILQVKNKGVITPRMLYQSKDNTSYSFEAFIIPQQIGNGTPLICIRNNNLPLVYSLQQDMDFRTGYSYEFNLNISSLFRKIGITGDIKNEKI